MSSSVDLARYRLEKAIEHLRSAQTLFEAGHFRDSISRSYYAIFTAVRALLAMEQLDSKKHSGVIALFNQHFVKTKVIDTPYGKIVKAAQTYREDADYTDYVIVTKAEAEIQCVNADSFIKKITQVLKDKYAV